MSHLPYVLRAVAANWLVFTFVLIALAAWIAQGRIASPAWNKRARRVRGTAILLALLMIFAVGCDDYDFTPSGCEDLVWEIIDLSGILDAPSDAHAAAMHGLAHAAATSATNALSSTPYLPFMGNLTLLSPAIDTSRHVYAPGLLRQSDCSLTEYFLALYNQSANTFSTQTTIPNYQNTLRSLAQLPAKTGSFPNGCKDSAQGVTSSGAVILGTTTDGSKYIAAGINPFTDTLLTGTIDLTNGAIVENTVSSVNNPASVATADLNGDGKNDLVVVADSTNTLAGQVVVFLSNGDGTFQAPVTYATNAEAATAVTVDDVNGDGKLDLVVTGYYSGQTSNGVQTLLGKGDGTFQAAVSSPVVGGSYLATGDFNGDGKKDLVLSNGEIALGKGDGTFATPSFTLPIAMGTNTAAGSVAVGDFNKDGKTDVAVNVPGGPYISLFYGKGDGTFTTGPSYANVNDASDLTVTDLDGDGNLDIISGLGSDGAYGPSVTTHTGIINVLMGNGDGTFQGAPAFPNAAAPIYTGSSSPAPAIAVGDFNGDGKMDILGSAASTKGGVVSASGLELLTGDGAGHFTASAAIGSSSPTVIAAADMNGDGKLDAVFADGSPANGPTNLGVALGDGHGGFGAVTDYAVPNSAPIANLITADFNGDGKTDVLVTTSGALTGGPNTIYLFVNNGDGTLATPVVIDSPATPPVGLAAGDLNGDGKLDFVLTTGPNNVASTAGAMLVYLNQGSGSFAAPVSYSPGYNPGPVTIGDMNGDSKLDIVVGSTDENYTAGTLSVYLGKGDGSFPAPQTLQATGMGAGNSLAIADIDGDGHPDVVWGGFLPMVAFGDGTGALEGPWGLALSPGAQTLVPVDLNGDKHPDFVSVSNNSIDVFMSLYGTAVAPLATTSTTLTVSPNPATVGQAVTFTAAVAPTSGTGTPTGTVSFMNGSTQLGTGTLDGTGKATYSTSSLAAATYSVTAVYDGDTSFSGSTSSAVSLTVNAATQTADFNLGANSPTLTVTAGQSATDTLSVTPENGFDQAVSFACSGLPSESTCTFSPTSVTPSGSSAATTTVTITTMAATSSQLVWPFAGGGLTFACAFFFFRRRRHLPGVFYVVLLAGIAGTTLGCGGGSHNSSTGGGNAGTPRGTSTVTITATAGTGASAISHTTTVTLTVQ